MKQMRFVKGLLVCLVMITIAGCFKNMGGVNNKDLINSYNNMIVGVNGITGYNLDLRIYGTHQGKSVNEIVRVVNYSDTDYEIMIMDPYYAGEDGSGEQIIYIKGDRTYIKNQSGKYVEANGEVKYSNPAMYLEGLKNIKKDSEPLEEKVANNVYKVYNVVVKKDVVIEMLENTKLIGVKVEEDIDTKIYIDEFGYVYRIIYTLEGLTINANYFGVNKVDGINFPEEIE
jgi:hypothetical protein